MRNSKISVAFNSRIFTHTLCTSQAGCGFALHHFHCGTQADGSICNFSVLVAEGKENMVKHILCFKLLLRNDTCCFCLHFIGQSKTNFKRVGSAVFLGAWKEENWNICELFNDCDRYCLLIEYWR